MLLSWVETGISRVARSLAVPFLFYMIFAILFTVAVIIDSRILTGDILIQLDNFNGIIFSIVFVLLLAAGHYSRAYSECIDSIPDRISQRVWEMVRIDSYDSNSKKEEYMFHRKRSLFKEFWWRHLVIITIIVVVIPALVLSYQVESPFDVISVLYLSFAGFQSVLRNGYVIGIEPRVDSKIREEVADTVLSHTRFVLIIFSIISQIIGITPSVSLFQIAITSTRVIIVLVSIYAALYIVNRAR